MLSQPQYRRIGQTRNDNRAQKTGQKGAQTLTGRGNADEQHENDRQQPLRRLEEVFRSTPHAADLAFRNASGPR